jgi:aryl-alcohol dehydrogenase-like predicted oxidoreductase
LRAGGLAIGVTVSGPRQADAVRRALDVRIDGENPFGVVQATWNVLEPSVGPALADAAAAGWGVIVKEALANGRLAPGGDVPAAIARLGVGHVATPDAIAIAAVLARPWAYVVLSGAATVDQLAANLRSTDVCLSGDELAELATLAEPADAYWAARSARRWA